MGNPSRVKVIGPLVPYVAGLRAELEARGYRPNAVCDQLRVLAHVSRWLAGRGLDVGQLTPARVEEFLVARRAEGYTLWCSPKGVAPLLAHLRRLAVVPVPEPAVATTPADQLLEDYRIYLVQERGLAAGTVASNLHVARLFVATRPRVPGLGLEELAASEVIDFVLAECRHRSAGSARYVVTGLRSLLRFCYLEGATARPLADAVPTVASWRLAGLPRALDPGAVAALLTRLGLRAGEVAALLLDDIDWRQGELVVRGKGPKQGRLPLPADVGEAVAGWLRRRPRCAVREVFTRVRAPHQGLSPAGVSAIVRAAAERAGMVQVHAHRLRHTAATEMLRAGAGLAEIGLVLGHQSVLTTSIYAKVDRSSLRALAKPWPRSDPGTVVQ